MKRNMDLIRDLMLRIEGDSDVDISSYSEKQQVYHMALLVEAGLIEGEIKHDDQGDIKAVIFTRLTWAGHEFLDEARNDTIWKKAKAKLSQAGIDAGIDVLKVILKSLINEQLGLH